MWFALAILYLTSMRCMIVYACQALVDKSLTRNIANSYEQTNRVRTSALLTAELFVANH